MLRLTCSLTPCIGRPRRQRNLIVHPVGGNAVSPPCSDAHRQPAGRTLKGDMAKCTPPGEPQVAPRPKTRNHPRPAEEACTRLEHEHLVSSTASSPPSRRTQLELRLLLSPRANHLVTESRADGLESRTFT